MAKKQSMVEALQRNKQLRRELDGDDLASSDSTLMLVNGTANSLSGGEPSPEANKVHLTTRLSSEQSSATNGGPPVWVRHTLGLQRETSLNLRDAAEFQKRKARRGKLVHNEPSNEQEIADLGINLALCHIGFSADES